jgi:hypothetical protein
MKSSHRPAWRLAARFVLATSTAFGAPMASAQYASLHSFDRNDGREPWGGLVQATNGWLYGVTDLGGTG